MTINSLNHTSYMQKCAIPQKYNVHICQCHTGTVTHFIKNLDCLNKSRFSDKIQQARETGRVMIDRTWPNQMQRIMLSANTCPHVKS